VPKILASKGYADGGLIAITSDGAPAPAATTPPAPTPTTPPATTTAPAPGPPATTTTTTTPAPSTTPTTETTPTTGAVTDVRASAAGAPAPCCNLKTFPNVGDAGAAGAGRTIGALLISKSVHAGRTSATPANPFTLLRTLEDLFQLQPLGYAAAASAKPLPQQIVPSGLS
jgi:hypothetical protein